MIEDIESIDNDLDLQNSPIELESALIVLRTIWNQLLIVSVRFMRFFMLLQMTNFISRMMPLRSIQAKLNQLIQE